jgi:hypothetical protein
VFKKNRPTVVKTKKAADDSDEEEKADVAEPVLTPKQKIALKKEREIQK